jgi:DNA-binding NarL/FixJ family response regulator
LADHGGTPPARVLILADDMIWSDRLVRAVRGAAAEPVAVRTIAALDAAVRVGDAVIVDLTARAYDGVEAIQRATAGGARTLAVGQHDDHDLRRRALAAGAERVLAYRKLAEDGPATIAAWIGRVGATSSGAAGAGAGR